MSEKIKMRNGDTMLIMVKDGEVVHFTPNMSWPHAEFVKRTTGQLPAGAWVGTVSKLDGKVVAISSKHFFDISFPDQTGFRPPLGTLLSELRLRSD
jgi:hypothetical protein